MLSLAALPRFWRFLKLLIRPILLARELLNLQIIVGVVITQKVCFLILVTMMIMKILIELPHWSQHSLKGLYQF